MTSWMLGWVLEGSWIDFWTILGSKSGRSTCLVHQHVWSINISGRSSCLVYQDVWSVEYGHLLQTIHVHSQLLAIVIYVHLFGDGFSVSIVGGGSSGTVVYIYICMFVYVCICFYYLSIVLSFVGF